MRGASALGGRNGGTILVVLALGPLVDLLLARVPGLDRAAVPATES